jgi:hypothetical protein
MDVSKDTLVVSPIGRMKVDKSGSAVAVVRIDAAQAYIGVPDLLTEFINNSNARAWENIKKKIDYIFLNLDHVLGQLDTETRFGQKVKAEVKAGKKLLFKPNLVGPTNIDPITHGEGLGNRACTEWPLVAAVMRWFHDKLDITYHQMALGEAASATSAIAGYFSSISKDGRRITTEAVIEGRSGDFFGGWGFYFARKYLTETHAKDHDDNPMNGYEESISGKYIPPGEAGARLMVYDLNRIDVKGKGRTVFVPDGANYKEITLHKVIVGGDPTDPDDCRDYPGSVLINIPRFKIHAIDLITNVIKNLGIGLYPMEVVFDDGLKNTHWKYAFPHKAIPGMKSEIPHQVWVPKADDESGLPVRNEKGEYIVTKTAGMSGTQADVIKAVQKQGVLMFHIVDSIQAINIDHQGTPMAVKVAEGLVMASLDPVALDCLCARYMFKTIPMAEARKLQKEHNLSTDFLQRVPVAKPDGANIVSDISFDSPLLRYNLFEYCEKRGLGKRKYYVVGWDTVTRLPLVSVAGHLGWVENGKFSEVMTTEFYHNPAKFLWDCQRTVLSYLEANDKLTGSNYREEIMTAFDENGDGVVDYDEMGRKGSLHTIMRLMAYGLYHLSSDEYGFLRGYFLLRSGMMKYSNAQWNKEAHDFTKESRIITAVYAAFQMSKQKMEVPDFLFPTLTWGNGKWPSAQFAGYMNIAMSIYGPAFPAKIDLQSLYGFAFQHADKTLNGAGYTGNSGLSGDLESANRYIEAVSQGAKPLNFVLFVPTGFGNMAGKTIPNVAETDDAGKVFTAQFNNGKETW